MMLEIVFFVKDIVLLNGFVLIIDGNKGVFLDIDGYIKVGGLLVYMFEGDILIDLFGEFGYQELCDVEQVYMVQLIIDDFDLLCYMQDVV